LRSLICGGPDPGGEEFLGENSPGDVRINGYGKGGERGVSVGFGSKKAYFRTGKKKIGLTAGGKLNLGFGWTILREERNDEGLRS